MISSGNTASASIPDRHRKQATWGRVLILAALGIAILSMVVDLVSKLAGADGAPFRCFASHGDAALRACEEVIAADSPPELRAEGYYNRGVELDHLGRPAEAALAYEHAVRLKPDYAAAYTNMGIALANLGRWDDAMRAYRVAIREQPEFADAHYNFGVALARLRRWAEALDAFQEAVRLNPADAAALYNMGLALSLLSRHAEAVQAYRAAVRVRPGYTDAWGNLGMTAYLLGRRSDSLEAFERARALVPTYFDDRPTQRKAWEQARRGNAPRLQREMGQDSRVLGSSRISSGLRREKGENSRFVVSASAQQIRMKLRVLDVRQPGELGAAFETMRREHTDANAPRVDRHR